MKLFIPSIVLFVLLAPLAAQAELKIGYVDAIMIFEKSPLTETAEKQLAKEFAAREEALRTEKSELAKLEKKLVVDAQVMSPSEREKLDSELASRKRDFRRKEADYMEDVKARQSEEMAKINKTIRNVIVDIGKEEKFDLVVYEGVAYASPAINITDKVLERLKANYAKDNTRKK